MFSHSTHTKQRLHTSSCIECTTSSPNEMEDKKYMVKKFGEPQKSSDVFFRFRFPVANRQNGKRDGPAFSAVGENLRWELRIEFEMCRFSIVDDQSDMFWHLWRYKMPPVAAASQGPMVGMLGAKQPNCFELGHSAVWSMMSGIVDF